ncbi:DUF3857 and transglutaminase domain-containing protein [Terrimonas sp. NA20]|uniref:DUF3857 and transglutaminase domain-containing protein n=1 Tax=Terrimonas ginsenosidimutans TaxID=2908004 RepID=A0ABS9KZC3_9BACT|nr:DUF3857 domain-containing protein [Terrimonas ginsenosidimutans]MCG2617656.1 DUF3857 and transglutaminase domain-containing protein [Terrimonas ginsenosidimutans]
MKVRFLLLFLLFLEFTPIFSQEKAKIKFGKVSVEDFKAKYTVDTSSGAVIIGDIGSTDFVGNTKGGFSIEFKRYCRIHVLNKSAYEILEVEIPIYTQGDREEELSSLKAVTYNLENGKVVETKVDPKNDVFKERISRNKVIRKFVFPAVREGAIIEMEYKLKSDFLFNLRPWNFQDRYPTLWSEYIVGMPEFLNYVSLTQGYQAFYIKEQKDKRESFAVEVPKQGVLQGTGNERINFSAGITFFRWVMKDLPALKEEGFTSTISNHVARIEFQLSEYREPFVPKKVMSTWNETMHVLMNDEDFGLSLQQPNEWLDGVMPGVLKNASTSLQKARNIYEWVRDNMVCTRRNSFYLTKSLKNTLNTKTGTEAEINLLLISMLRKAGLQADPVILSTRSNGYTYALYPLIDRFNYVVIRLLIDDKKYFLDASRPQLGFDKLGFDCYNGHARVVADSAEGVELKSESLMERSLTSVFLSNSAEGKLVAGLQHAPGYYESSAIRSAVKDKGLNAYMDDLRKNVGDDESTVSEASIDSLYNYESPLVVKCKITYPADNADVWYFDPVFMKSWAQNPFKSAERFYPVEMPYAVDQTHLFRMDVPEGYTVDELPKSVIVKLNKEDEGNFEYRTMEANGVITIRCRLRISRTYFDPEEYNMLREFFDLVVKKQSEQIVFKKKK